jgi:membrane fusion protein (multidrug efflux system)
VRRCNPIMQPLGCAFLVVLTCCHASTDDAKEASLPVVQTAPLLRGTAIEELEVAGTLQPLPGLDVKLGALTAGRLLELKKGEGDAVKAGELLARIDPAPLLAQVEQAKAQLAQAKAQADNAGLKLSRTTRAVTAGVAARQEQEDAQLGNSQADGAVRAAQGAVSAAENQLARSELRAPFDGLIARVFAQPGEPVDAGKIVLEVARTQELELRAAVPAESAARLRNGQTAQVTTPGVQALARVIAVAPVIDAATGSATVRLRVANPDGALKAGGFAKARVAIAQHENALLAPRTALLPSEDGSAEPGQARLCSIDKDSKVHCTTVQIRDAQGGQVEVVSGLEAGAQVIIQGAYALPEGTKVSVGAPAKAEAAGAAAAGGKDDKDEKK